MPRIVDLDLTGGDDVVYPQTLTDEAVRAGKLARFYVFLVCSRFGSVREAGWKTDLVMNPKALSGLGHRAEAAFFQGVAASS